MKRILCALIASLLAFALCFAAFAADVTEVKMTIGSTVAYVNGNATALDTAPIIRNDRTMLPVRFVAEAFGANVAWDGATSTATLSTDTVEVVIVIGAENATVNGETVVLDSPAFIENDRTYMPVRFVAESLGATVAWDSATSTATLTYEKKYELFPDEYFVKYPDGFDYLGANMDEYVVLPEYKGMVVNGEIPAEVTDADVKAYIDELVAEYPVLNPITDRTANYGDCAIINYVGKMDGVAFEGGSANNQTLYIGMGAYIPGFEEGIIGMSVGQTKAIDVVFPEDYYTEFAGKAATFEITLLSLYEEIPAEYNLEFVKTNFNMDSLEVFEQKVRDLLVLEREEAINEIKRTNGFEAVCNAATVKKYPESLVEDYMFEQIFAIKVTAAMYSMTYETFIIYGNGTTVEEFESALRALAESTIKQQLVATAILQKEGLAPTEDEFNTELIGLIAYYSCTTKEELCESLGITAPMLDNILMRALVLDKAQRFLATCVLLAQ